MPDYFSHSICARKIFEKLDPQRKNMIDDFTLYLLGAQGGDVFFPYKLSVKKTNLGRKLHAIAPEELFTLLKERNQSYAAGFATHYALDCTLHPVIYAYESTSKHPLAHMRFEKDLGLFISRLTSIPRNILPRERVLGATFPIYDCMKNVEQKITVTGVERCLKRHFAYTRALIKNKKSKYVLSYDFCSLSGAVDDAIDMGVQCAAAVLSGEVDGGIFGRSFLEK